MRRERRAGLPHDVDARAELVLLGGAVDGIETQAEIHRDGGREPPFVLQVDAVGPANEIRAVSEADGLVGGDQIARSDRRGRRHQRQGIAVGEGWWRARAAPGSRHVACGRWRPSRSRRPARRPRSSSAWSTARCRCTAGRRWRPAGRTVWSNGRSRKPGSRAFRSSSAARRCRSRSAPTGAGRECALFQSLLPKTVKLAALKGTLGIWKRELAPPPMKLTACLLVDDAGDLGQPVPLIGVVVEGRERRRRIIDPKTVVDVLAGREIVDLPGPAAVGEGGLRVVARATSDRELGARIGGAGLERDVDDARCLQPVLGGQRAGEQRHPCGVARGQYVVEQRQALRQLHAVEPVLDVAHVAAHMDLPKTVLHDAGRAQQHLVQRRVLAQWRRCRWCAARSRRSWRRGSAGWNCALHRAASP